MSQFPIIHEQIQKEQNMKKLREEEEKVKELKEKEEQEQKEQQEQQEQEKQQEKERQQLYSKPLEAPKSKECEGYIFITPCDALFVSYLWCLEFGLPIIRYDWHKVSDKTITFRAHVRVMVKVVKKTSCTNRSNVFCAPSFSRMVFAGQRNMVSIWSPRNDSSLFCSIL